MHRQIYRTDNGMGKEVHRERIDVLKFQEWKIHIVIIQTAVHLNHLFSQCYVKTKELAFEYKNTSEAI